MVTEHTKIYLQISSGPKETEPPEETETPEITPVAPQTGAEAIVPVAPDVVGG